MKYKTKVILYVEIAMLAFIGGAYFIYQQRTHFNEKCYDQWDQCWWLER